MKRVAAVLLLALAGCSELSGRWSDLDADDFSSGTAPQEKFFADARACAGEAEAKRSYSIDGINADNVERHRIYNAAFSACMTAHGYQKREGWWAW